MSDQALRHAQLEAVAKWNLDKANAAGRKGDTAACARFNANRKACEDQING